MTEQAWSIAHIYWEVRWRMTRARAGEAERWGGGGDHSRIKITGMLVGKLESNPLKETNLGVAQLYLTPKEDLTPFVIFI